MGIKEAHYEKRKNFICASRGADDSFPALRLQSSTKEEISLAKSAKRREIYPTAATAEDALHAGELFVLEDEGVVQAAARINRIQVPGMQMQTGNTAMRRKIKSWCCIPL